MTYAIVTGSGQSRFLTYRQTLALAPNRDIMLFATRREAETYHAANKGRFVNLLALKTPCLVIPATAKSTGGTIATT